MKLEGVESPEEAQLLRGHSLLIPATARKALADEDEFYVQVRGWQQARIAQGCLQTVRQGFTLHVPGLGQPIKAQEAAACRPWGTSYLITADVFRGVQPPACGRLALQDLVGLRVFLAGSQEELGLVVDLFDGTGDGGARSWV